MKSCEQLSKMRLLSYEMYLKKNLCQIIPTNSNIIFVAGSRIDGSGVACITHCLSCRGTVGLKAAIWQNKSTQLKKLSCKFTELFNCQIILKQQSQKILFSLSTQPPCCDHQKFSVIFLNV
jgi:hypothetical protein